VKVNVQHYLAQKDYNCLKAYCLFINTNMSDLP